MACDLTMSSRRSHSCPFVSIRGSNTASIRAHSCSFVVQKHRLLFVPFGVFRGPIPPTTSPLRFIRENPCSSVARKTRLIRLIRGLEPRLPVCPSPLTPGPSPLPGARGAMWGCLGDLVLKPELHWHATYSCPATDLIRVHSWFKHRLHSWFNTASIRGGTPPLIPGSPATGSPQPRLPGSWPVAHCAHHRLASGPRHRAREAERSMDHGKTKPPSSDPPQLDLR